MVVLAVVFGLVITGCSVDEETMVDAAAPAAAAVGDPPSAGEPSNAIDEGGEAPPGSREFCVEFPIDESCDAFFDALSDEEFCGLLPDDPFCAEFLEGLGDEGAAGPPAPATPPAPTAPAGGGAPAVAGIDPTLLRDDGRCLPEEDEEDQAGIEYNLAYQVVDGVLGSVCFGSPDETVEWAWRVLADLTPPDQLRDLAVFGGFTSTEDDGVTLAFVQRLDDDGTQFLMAVNVAETRSDEEEAILTMAHELTHVFTALPGELDRFILPGDCTTFDNGEGCYEPDSIIHRWFEEFWTAAPGDPNDADDAGPRCDLDAGFFGSYAATTPEEDFAEAFSAYVLRVEATTDGQQRRLDFIDAFPGLREFRDRAAELGYGPLENRFGLCG